MITAAPPAPRPRGQRLRRLPAVIQWIRQHPGVLVLALAAAAAVWAVVGSHRVFPYLSDDHDESLYLLQAEALADGHLFPPAPRHPDAFLPWLSVLSDEGFVTKYTPVHASILAVGALLGDARLSLALIAAGVVAISYALGKEVLGDRRLAALASGFLVLSPLFVLQSATFLPYCSSLLLLEAFALTLLRGVRTDGALLLAASGLLFGMAVFARPFDALLFALPLALYVLVSRRHQGRELARHGGWFALGAAMPLAAMLAYFAAATGSPFRPPFNLLEPSDTLGFGPRRLLPGQPALPFTPARGWQGVSRHVLLTSFWGFGGLLLIGFFLGGVLRRPRTAVQSWLALVAVTFSCGYLFFWGTYGTSLQGSLTSFLGPFYFLPVLVPVTLLAAKGVGELWRRDQVIAGLALVGMVAVSGYLLVESLQVNLRLAQEDRRLYAPAAAVDHDRALILVPPLWGPHLLHPFAALRNRPDYAGPTVYALDRSEPENLMLIEDFPGRVAYRMRVHGSYRVNPPDPGLTTSLERLAVLEGASFDTTLTLPNPTAYPYVIVAVAHNGTKVTFTVDTSSQSGAANEAGISIGAESVEWRGPLAGRFTEVVPADGTISVSISAGPADGGSSRVLYQRELAYTAEGPILRVLWPGTVLVDELDRDPLAVPGAG